MFTGIIEHLGRVEFLRAEPWGARLVIDTQAWAYHPADGDSVSVNGCCLTVVGQPAAHEPIAFDVIGQTLALTTVGRFQTGDMVNLERAVSAATLLGGHLVQGHVDGIGEVRSVSTTDGEWRTRIGFKPTRTDLIECMTPQGSVAVDGVSLTIAALGDDWFEVALIPATLSKTTLRGRLAGSEVNLEVDSLAKMVSLQVKRALAAAAKRP